MSTSTIQKQSAAANLVIPDTNWPSRDISIVSEWPTAWSGNNKYEGMKDYMSTFNHLSEIDGFGSYIKTKNGELILNLARDVNVTPGTSPDDVLGFSTYITNKFYKDVLRGSNQAMKYNVRVGQATIPIYSRRLTNPSGNVEDQFTTHDAEVAASTAINCCVKSALSKNQYLLTAKARVLVSDEGISEIAQTVNTYYEEMGSRQSWNEVRVIQSLNAGCCNKSQQFRNAPFFDPNIYAAVVLGGVMKAKTQKQITMEIAAQKISKIARIPSESRFNKKVIGDIVQDMNFNNEIKLEEVENMMRDILNPVNRKKNIKYAMTPRQMHFTPIEKSAQSSLATSGDGNTGEPVKKLTNEFLDGESSS